MSLENSATALEEPISPKGTETPYTSFLWCSLLYIRRTDIPEGDGNVIAIDINIDYFSIRRTDIPEGDGNALSCLLRDPSVLLEEPISPKGTETFYTLNLSLGFIIIRRTDIPEGDGNEIIY